MFKNYVVIAFRILLKHKVFSAINIAGLSIGISCCLLLALFIQDEYSYDLFLPLPDTRWLVFGVS